MRVIVAGSRSINDIELVTKAIEASGFEVTEIVSGGAHGVDWFGEQYAKAHHTALKRFLAEWHTHGWQAGFIRNKAMAWYADALVAVWDGQSRGTKHMIASAKEHGLKVYIHEVHL